MAATLKCLDCDARWYVVVGMGRCPNCGSDEVDVDVEARKRMKKQPAPILNTPFTEGCCHPKGRRGGAGNNN